MSNLYIVATPIGNLQDITIRAAHAILTCQILVSESTSKAGTLLEFLKIEFPGVISDNKQIVSFTEDEEELKIPQILKLLESDDVVLISEAGTPLISDPGFKIVREAVKRGVNVVPLPGPTAAIAALSVSGLPTDKFLFLGYLPKKDSKLKELLSNLKLVRGTLNATGIIYESPHRLIATLNILKGTFGNVDLVIARELTKIHEEVRREKIADSIEHFTTTSPRGEFVILL